jgi:hypothetical protein
LTAQERAKVIDMGTSNDFGISMAHANATHKQILIKIYKRFDILKVSDNRTHYCKQNLMKLKILIKTKK